MKCIVWLGNPGPEYANTRHNMGALALDFLREQWGFPEFTASKHHAVISEGSRNGEKILLVKPVTYMNLSGRSVASIVWFYKLDPSLGLIVLSDDLDMEFGKIRYREKGSSGWQNGIKSIIESIGTEEFCRIKIGIGRDPKFEVSDWVLSKLSKQEMEKLDEEVFPEATKKVEEWL